MAVSLAGKGKQKPQPIRLVRSMEFGTLTDGFTAASYRLPFTTSGRRYYQAVLERPVREFNFSLVDGDGPIAVAQCDDMQAGPLARFGAPIEIWRRPGLDMEQGRRIVRETIAEFQRIARDEGFDAISLRTSARLDPDGMFTARLCEMGATPILTLRSQLDLSLDDDALLADMRKGHRQQVRWGQQNLELSFVDSNNPDRALFEEYRSLHAEIAGRVTRPAASWDRMFELIAAGEGDLIMCRFEGMKMGGTLILDGGDESFYASGAYRRDSFDKPLTHYPLFHAARRARERGRRMFDVGETCGGTMDPTNAKERAIGSFKSGFSGRCDVSMVWTLPRGVQ